MKHLLTGVAVVAALAFAAPSWAQAPNPSGGNPVGMPGPNPGGPGLTPYSGGAARTMAPPPSAPPAAMAPSAGAPAETSSAMPPPHRHARHASHGKMAGHHGGKATQLTGSNADQLNQEELARLQAGNVSNPPVVPSNPLPGPGMAPPPPPMGTPMGTSGGTSPYHP
jgi:hypothetical protein